MAVATPVSRAVPEGHPTGTHADVTRDVVATLGPASRGYVLLLLGAVSLFLIGILTFLVLIKDGLGHAGYNPPIFWSVYITTFVFWVGIGHAGTLISAILFLFRSPWRTAVYRSTEAMTVFAVMTAGTFPLLPAKVCTTSGSEGNGLLIGETSQRIYIGESGGAKRQVISFPLTQVKQTFIGGDAVFEWCR